MTQAAPQSGGGAVGPAPRPGAAAGACPRCAFVVAGAEPAEGGAFGAGIDATIDRAPVAPTARTPAHSSSSCRFNEHDVTVPSGTTCSQVGAVVRRMTSSYDTAPSEGCQLSVHA